MIGVLNPFGFFSETLILSSSLHVNSICYHDKQRCESRNNKIHGMGWRVVVGPSGLVLGGTFAGQVANAGTWMDCGLHSIENLVEVSSRYSHFHIMLASQFRTSVPECFILLQE